MKTNGDDVRNGIYLPDKNQVWIDYYTGKEYQGGQVINNFDAPLWKLPVFIKAGAIIPTAPATNTPKDYLAERNQRQFEIYPSAKESNFDVYEDDGVSAKYQTGEVANTKVTSKLTNNNLTINVGKTTGRYEGMDTQRTTEFDIRTKKEPTKVTVKVGGQNVTLTQATSASDFNTGTNVYFFDPAYQTNSYLTDAGGTGLDQKFLRIKLGKTDVSQSDIEVNVEGIDETTDITNAIPAEDTSIKVPENIKQDETTTTPTSVGITWNTVDGATGYNIKVDGVVYTKINNPNFVLNEVKPNTEHTFQVQTVTTTGVSAWSSEAKFMSAEDPLKNAVQISYDHTTSNLGTTDSNIWQSGNPVKNLFDHDLTNLAHTRWSPAPAAGVSATPLTITAHLDGITDLDKLVYVPRDNGGNGNISGMIVQTSIDGIHWHETDASGWNNADNSHKEIKFAPGTKAYYLKFTIPAGVTRGNYFSGNEILLYQKDGSDTVFPGDITGDHSIDSNDEMSLHNYVGETLGKDSDFEGYVENGDMNQNGTIDAFDIDYIMTQIGNRANFGSDGNIVPSGKLIIRTDKAKYKQGDTITVTVSGKDLSHVNALSARLPYDTDELEFEDIENGDLTNGMVSFAKNKIHSNGDTDVYVVYSNRGEAPRINSALGTIATIKFKALKPVNGNNISFVLTDQMLANQYAKEYEPEDSKTVTVRIKGNGSTNATGNGTGTSNSSSGISTGSGTSSSPSLPSDSNTNNKPGTEKPETSKPNKVTSIPKEMKPIYHNAYIYDINGIKIRHGLLKVGEKVVIQGIVTINNKKFYDIGNDQFIAAGNVDGTSLKLKHNSFIYNKHGKHIKGRMLGKGKKCLIYGKSVKIKGKQFYSIGHNQFIKKNNFAKK